MRIIPKKTYNPGDKKSIQAEEPLEDVKFNIFKFNNRPKPQDGRRIIIITNFSEFGCESIALMYCIPRILKKFPGCYFIAAGWYGREYLYRHLVDEYWEIKEEHQWLREYSMAFTHKSKNLARIEKGLSEHGQVLSGSYFGHICLGNTCLHCRHFWENQQYVDRCTKCGSVDVDRALFGDIPFHKKQAVHIPFPDNTAMEKADQLLGKVEKPLVGIFARGRQCYGRNLPLEFYKKLVDRLDEYQIVWLGEKQSTIAAPEGILDFSRMPESRNLELTLAILSRCEFTIQFWTASTRLAAMVGTPWMLFESPDQIVGKGQEGMRIALTTDEDKKKLILSHYLNVLNDHDKAISLVERGIEEMKAGNWSDIVGMVEDHDAVQGMLEKQKEWNR